MRKSIVAIGFVVLVVLLALAAIIELGPQHGAQTASISTTASTSNGLVLIVRANATSLPYGGQLLLNLDVTNDKSGRISVPLGDEWPIQNLSLSSCGRLYYPFGVALVAGAYGKSNFSLGTVIPIFKTSAGNLTSDCPNPYYTTPVNYVFGAKSDLAVVHYQAGPNATLSMNFTAGIGDYVDSSGFTVPLPEGTYTLACGDSWGGLILVHFDVR